MSSINIGINKILSKLGYKIVHTPDTKFLPHDLDPEFAPLYKMCKPFSKTTFERMYSMFQATNYIVASNIPGAFVECGVWRGGSIMMSAARLKQLQVMDRELYLYDTYAGMSEPTDRDITLKGNDPALPRWKKMQREGYNEWTLASLDEVQKNIYSTHYSKEKIYFVKGKVEDTIPQTMPETIALLRLDTDWYESTKHEMVHLFPRLVVGGVIIIDDYGAFKGAREAIDEYIKEKNIKIFLNRVDYTGRVGIKIEK